MNTSVGVSGAPPRAGGALRVTIWIATIILALLFCGIGFMKLGTPIPKLVAGGLKWAGQYPPWFVRLMGAIDMAGGLGVLLPALTRVAPRLTVLAALGCTVLQICAIAFHSSRGEFSVLPLNFVLLALSLFVLWGRSKKAPILPRR